MVAFAVDDLSSACGCALRVLMHCDFVAVHSLKKREVDSRSLNVMFTVTSQWCPLTTPQ